MNLFVQSLFPFNPAVNVFNIVSIQSKDTPICPDSSCEDGDYYEIIFSTVSGSEIHWTYLSQTQRDTDLGMLRSIVPATTIIADGGYI